LHNLPHSSSNTTFHLFLGHGSKGRYFICVKSFDTPLVILLHVFLHILLYASSERLFHTYTFTHSVSTPYISPSSPPSYQVPTNSTAQSLEATLPMFNSVLHRIRWEYRLLPYILKIVHFGIAGARAGLSDADAVWAGDLWCGERVCHCCGKEGCEEG
jgi:hypothetical protein